MVVDDKFCGKLMKSSGVLNSVCVHDVGLF